MKQFLAVYTGAPDAMMKWNELPEAERQQRGMAGMKAWHAWVEHNKQNIVELGGPLSRTKRINKEGIADIRNHLSAFTIVRAESQEAAAGLFVDHPHFSIFPGDGVEVMEIMPVPTM